MVKKITKKGEIEHTLVIPEEAFVTVSDSKIFVVFMVEYKESGFTSTLIHVFSKDFYDYEEVEECD